MPRGEHGSLSDLRAIFRRPKTRGGVAYFGVLGVCLLGLVLCLLEWRRGLMLIGLGLVAGAGARLVLGEYDAGMLRVRRRWFDAPVMAAAGIALIVLGATIPDQPGT